MTSPRVLHTTLGPLPRERFGIILPHEHVYVDFRSPDDPAHAKGPVNDVVRKMAVMEPSPEVAAEAHLRQLMSFDQADHEASYSGLNAERFAILSKTRDLPPDPTTLAHALRRKIIDQDRYMAGIRASCVPEPVTLVTLIFG